MVADDSDPRAHPIALTILWQRRVMIATIAGAATAIAALALEVIEPRYTAEALIALNTRPRPTEQVLTTKPMVATPPLATVLVSTEKDILTSRELTTKVVDALALDRDPEFNRLLRPHRLPDRLDQVWRAVKHLLAGGPDKDAHTLAIDTVMEHLAVKNGPDSFAIRLSFDSHDPRKAALIANAYADLYIRGQSEAKLADMQVATDWITKQITHLRTELEIATAKAVELRRKNGLAPVDAREKGLVAAQQMITLNTDLVQAERERVEAESALAQARRQMSGGNLASLTFVDQSPFLQEMRKEEAKVLARIAELSAGYRDDSPALAGLKSQLGTLRHEIDGEIGKQVDGLAHKAAQAKAREDALKARIAGLTRSSTASDGAMAAIDQSEQDIKAKTLMLESFLQRYAELTNRTEIEDSDARVVSRATPPAKPSFPKPFLFLGVAFTGSLGLGATLALLLDRFRSGFNSTREIRDAVGLATLGIVPDVSRMAGGSQPADFLVDKPETVYAEAVRSTQLAVMNARADHTRPIMLTSSLPGEGKTALAVGLGRSLALAERKVLLIDADLRRPRVAAQIGGYEIPGLADHVRQQASLEEIVRHDPRTGLDFVPSGARIGDPQTLLADPRCRAAIETLRAAYDIVLIDTPPVMAVSDAALLAPLCDFAIYVIEWNRTPRRAVEAGIELLKSFDLAIGGAVLSKVDLDRQRQYDDYVDFCFRNSEYYNR